MFTAKEERAISQEISDKNRKELEEKLNPRFISSMDRVLGLIRERANEGHFSAVLLVGDIVGRCDKNEKIEHDINRMLRGMVIKQLDDLGYKVKMGAGGKVYDVTW